MSKIEDSLKAFDNLMNTISDEKLDKMIAEIDAKGIEGPSVDEYMQRVSKAVAFYSDWSKEFVMSEMLDLVEKGYLVSQTHPTLDLTIFNYSRKTQFDKYWNDITLACRGLVLNSEGKVIARCLRKFFNLQEVDVSLIPKTTFKVYEKLDGSYLQIFKYKNELVFSSRGSFTSDQALKAHEIFYKKYSHLSDQILEGYNYVFEIIYPQNRIVVDYGKVEDIILITVINNETREDRLLDIGFPMVKQYDALTDIDQILKMHVDNSEGFVIKFDKPNDIDPERYKSKYAEYLRLHRILTMCSSRDVWNALRIGDDMTDILERVPDEFDNWIRETKDKLYAEYKVIEDYCLEKFKVINILCLLRALPNGSASNVPSQKLMAQYIYKQKYRSVLFQMMNKQDYSKTIWDMIEPEYERAFMNFNSLSNTEDL